MGCELRPADAGRSRSSRNRKSGETSTAWMPTASPSASERSCSSASRTSATYLFTSAYETGRLNARLVRSVMIRVARCAALG